MEHHKDDRFFHAVDNRVVQSQTLLVPHGWFHKIRFTHVIVASQHTALENVLVLVVVRHSVDRLCRVIEVAAEVDASTKNRCYTETYHSNVS